MKIKTLKISGNQGFSILNGINRAIKPAQVTKLAESINKIGIIRPVIVACLPFMYNTKELFIIDGQHLYHACLRNNIDIPYIEIEINDEIEMIETLALLNASSKSWILQDYILSWSYINNDYRKLSHYFKTFDLELSQIAELFYYGSTRTNHGGSSITRVIKRGLFEIKNEEFALQILNNITDILKIVPRLDRNSNKAFISAYITFYKQFQNIYNHNNFINHLKNNKEKFVFATQDPNEFSKAFEMYL